MRRGKLDAGMEQACRDGLNAALDAGEAVLANRGSAVDAVEAVARLLEDDPAFNAGRGSTLTHEGHVECDAAIMSGAERRAGAVAGMRSTKNPISAARAVMMDSPHVLMSKDGADEFAREVGLEQVPNAYFITEERHRQLIEMLSKGADAFDTDIKYGTIGAVAVDANGHVAAATSTGGLTAKRWGRIGDSPLIGAGTYADDRAAAVSATGLGEVFIRAAAAHEVCARMRHAGVGLQQALDDVLAEVQDMGGTGGMIAVAPTGEAAWSFTTPGMYRARSTSEGKRDVAIFGDE